jgi:hypothetical protein
LPIAARLAAARRHRRQAEHHREQVHAHRGFGAAIGEHDMAVGDVAEFVRDHALDFVRIVRRLEQARMDIDGLAARDERIDRIVVDQHDLDVARRQARRRDQRAGHFGEHRFGFRIAEDRLRLRGLRPEQEGGGQGRDEALHIAQYRRSAAGEQWRGRRRGRVRRPMVSCRT